MATGCFISTGRSFDDAIARVRLAESLGYESAWVTHINGRDALAVITAYACNTDRIRLGTGVMPIYTRTPAAMAQEAATIADLSGERLNLGLGVSHRPVVEAWHGQTIDKPVTETREYVALVRAILRGERPPEGVEVDDEVRPCRDRPASRTSRSTSPACPRTCCAWPARSPTASCCGSATRTTSATSSSRRCARVARRPGKPLEGFDIVAAVPSARTDDVGAVYDAQRRDLLPYFGLPFYRAMLERSGFSEDIERYDAAAGDPVAMAAGISDAFLDTLTAVGDDAAVQAGIARYLEAGATSPCIGPIAKSDFDATLRAGAPAPR